MSGEWKGEGSARDTTPEHYRTNGGLQPWHVVDAFGLDFYSGNALKYLLRAGKKGDRLLDLRKAAHYLQYLIEREEVQRREEFKDAIARDAKARVEDAIQSSENPLYPPPPPSQADPELITFTYMEGDPSPEAAKLLRRWHNRGDKRAQ